MLLQQHTTNIRSGKDVVAYSYDFTGNCIKKKQIHSSEGNKTHTLELLYTYDGMGRQLDMEVSYDDTLAVKVNAFKYDDMGRLVANERNGMESLRTTYGYDIRHHLTDISGENFSQKIHYVDASNGNTPCYNGNISAMEWSIGYKGAYHGYAYKYDGLSRLVSADYYRNGKKTGDYSTSYSYDLMGNVKSLTRNGLLDDRGHGLVDNLSYEYHGNQVARVTDAVSGPYYKNAMHFVDGADEKIEYEYNKNGAMTKDLNKGIELIEYNQLNLPTKVVFADGSIIRNIYDADGNKLRTCYHIKLQSAVSSSNNGSSNAKYIDYRRDYCGSVEYRDDELSCWRYDGGHLEFAENDSPVYLYELKDYQGNVRVSVTGDKDNVITDANHYYPFGGLMGCSQVGAYQYRYNDKELELTHGLNWYDYGARSYDGMRFVVPDAMCEISTSVSPYAYCNNNPIRFVDYKGLLYGDFYDEKGMLLGNDGINDKKVYVIKTTKSSFEDESFGNAPVAGISKKEAKAAKAEIASNSGDASHDFSQAKSSFVELDGSQEIRQEVLSKIEDDGSGGTKESNNREYGMNYERNEPLKVYSQKGQPGVSGEGTEVSVFSGDQAGLVYYHTHPSGTNGMYRWGQAPSYKDVDNKKDTETNSYVIGMRNKMVYIYNKSGIISTFPLSIFTK